jgi:hypothetical protein
LQTNVQARRSAALAIARLVNSDAKQLRVCSAAAFFGSKALDSNLTCAQDHSYTNEMTGGETHDIFGAAEATIQCVPTNFAV